MGWWERVRRVKEKYMLYPPLAHISSFRSAGNNMRLLPRVGIFLSLPLLFCWGRGRGRFGMLLVCILVYVLKYPVSCMIYVEARC
jgi:hypothetical protein